MKKLQLTEEEDVRYRCYLGLANVIYTDLKLAKSIKK